MSDTADNLRALNRAINQAIHASGDYDLDSIRRFYHLLLMEIASRAPAAVFGVALEVAGFEFVEWKRAELELAQNYRRSQSR